MSARIRMVLVGGLVVSACTSAEMSAAKTDFASGCADWQAAKSLVELATSPVPYADTIEDYVSDACDLGSALAANPTAEDAVWIKASASNLKAAARLTVN